MPKSTHSSLDPETTLIIKKRHLDFLIRRSLFACNAQYSEEEADHFMDNLFVDMDSFVKGIITIPGEIQLSPGPLPN